jgi:tryptophan halogenase
MASLEAEAITPPRQPLRFTAGRRRKFWSRNCVALGLASGFLEPLESTSIHLVQRGLALLLKLFPDRHFAQAEQDQYNAMLGYEYERIRDFIILHYCASRRDDDAFWRDVRNTAPPDSLAHRIELFTSHGRIIREENELFPAQSWLYIFMGQGLKPRYADPMAAALDAGELEARLGHLKTLIANAAATMGPHEAFIAAQCAAEDLPA